MLRTTALRTGLFSLAITGAVACGGAGPEEMGTDEGAYGVHPTEHTGVFIVDAPPGLTATERGALEYGSEITLGGDGQHALSFGKAYVVKHGSACVRLWDAVDAFYQATRQPGYNATQCFTVAAGTTVHAKPSTLRFSAVRDKLTSDFGEAAAPTLSLTGGSPAGAGLALEQAFHMPYQHTHFDGARAFGTVTETTWTGYPPEPSKPQLIALFAGHYDVTLSFGTLGWDARPVWSAGFDVAPGTTKTFVVDPPELRGTLVVAPPSRELPSASSSTAHVVTLRASGASAEIARAEGPEPIKARRLRFFPEAWATPVETFRYEVNGVSFEAPAPSAGESVDVPLRRIDVHHLKKANGATERGTFKIHRIDPTSGWSDALPRFNAQVPTGTGLDLLPGHYDLTIVTATSGDHASVDLPQ